MVLFNINNLITTEIQQIIDNASSSKDKVKSLFQLISLDTNGDFNDKLIEEAIKKYSNATGESYVDCVDGEITPDIENLLLEYAEYDNNIENIKPLLSSIYSGDEDIKEQAIENARQKIDEIKDKIKQEAKEATTKIFDDIIFDDVLFDED